MRISARTKSIKENEQYYNALKVRVRLAREELAALIAEQAEMERSMVSKKLIDRFHIDDLFVTGSITRWDLNFLIGTLAFRYRLSDKQQKTYQKIFIESGENKNIEDLYNYLTTKPTKDENNERKGE